MIKKDFIQRYVDELAKVMAAVLQLKNDSKPIEAVAELNDFSSDYLKVHLKDILKLAPNQVITFLIDQKDFELLHFKLLEEVLYQHHLIDPNNSTLKNISLEVLRHTAKNDSNYVVDRMNRITQMQQT